MTAGSSLRIRLRPLLAADAPRLDPWLPEAVAAVQGRGERSDPGLALPELLRRWDVQYPPGRTLTGELLDGTPVGLLRVRTGDHARLVIDALTVRADARNLGYGQEMVFALEASQTTAGGRALAGVPRGNGLAVYFWLRTGYRPLYPVAAPADGLDGTPLWMTRTLERLGGGFGGPASVSGVRCQSSGTLPSAPASA